MGALNLLAQQHTSDWLLLSSYRALCFWNHSICSFHKMLAYCWVSPYLCHMCLPLRVRRDLCPISCFSVTASFMPPVYKLPLGREVPLLFSNNIGIKYLHKPLKSIWSEIEIEIDERLRNKGSSGWRQVKEGHSSQCCFDTGCSTFWSHWAHAYHCWKIAAAPKGI